MQEGSEIMLKQLEEMRDLFRIYSDEPQAFMSYDFHDIAFEIINELENILVKKGQDYSGDRNQWHNFEFAADMSNLTPEQILVVMASIKFSRLNTLIQKDGKPNFESFEDNIKDLINYLFLLIGYLEWKKSIPPQKD